MSVRRLRLYRLYVDELTAILAFGEHYHAVDERVDGVILAQTYIETGMMHGAALTLNDVAGFSKLTAKNLNTQSLAF